MVLLLIFLLSGLAGANDSINVSRRFVLGGMAGFAARVTLPSAAISPAPFPSLPTLSSEVPLSELIALAWDQILSSTDPKLFAVISDPTKISNLDFLRLGATGFVGIEAYEEHLHTQGMQPIPERGTEAYQRLVSFKRHVFPFNFKSDHLFWKAIWSRVLAHLRLQYPRLSASAMYRAFDDVPEADLLRLAFPEVRPEALEVATNRLARDRLRMIREGLTEDKARTVDEAMRRVKREAFHAFPSSFSTRLEWIEPWNRLSTCADYL